MSRLGEIPLFAGLTPEELERLRESMVVENHNDGDALFRQGDEAGHVFIVKRGSVRIFAEHDGVEETYTTLSVGAVFGEIGVLKHQRRSASAVAVGPVSCYVFSGATFEILVEECPGIAQMVNQTMFGRFRADARRAERREARAARPGATLIPMFSATGGCGLSLAVANLATYLKEVTKKRVLVADLDLMFGDQAELFGIDGGLSLSDLVMEEHLDVGMLEEVIQKTPAGVDVLRAPVQPEHAEFVIPGFPGSILDLVSQSYDYIFCDTGSRVTDVTLELIERAGVAVYVLTPELPSLKNAQRWFSVVHRVGLPVDSIRVLANKIEPEDESAMKVVEDRYGPQLLDRIPFDPVNAKAASNLGKPFAELNPRAEIAKAYRRAAGKLVGLEVDSFSEESPWWSRWI